jgi:hypothetical protein
MKTGIELIADERKRVVNEEGFTPHQDKQYDNDELLQAACVYISTSSKFELGVDASWPFDAEWFKPTTRVRNLVKAGQFIAAEIDRLQRLRG